MSDIRESLKPTKMKSPQTKTSASSNPRNALEREAAEQKRIADAKAAFQDAVYDAFKRRGTKPNTSERALLRDRLANASCPQDVADDLRGGAVQLDTTEFLNFFLASVMPEENRVAVVSNVKWGTGAKKEEKSRIETQTKLEFSFPAGGGTATLPGMLAGYQNEEDLKGANQYEITPGKKINAKKNLQPQVTNPEAEIVISLKRFEYEIKGGELSRKKINDPVSLNDISLPLQADPNTMRNYRATSFIVHQGGLGGGHYIAYVQESDKRWYCYNDSSKTAVSDDDLEKAKAQAYVVKYSPIDALSNECRLPESQGRNGTANGGNRCWANAAFAFALSMTSLHDDKHKRSVETAAPKIQNEHRIEKITAAGANHTAEEIEIEKHVKKILNLDEESDLKAVLKELESIKPEIRKPLNDRLEEIGAVSTSGLLQNAAQTYLLKLTNKQDDKKTDAILGLSGFFSDERNREDVLKIIEAVDANETDFIADPQEFCANLISPLDPTEAKKELMPKATHFVTTADLCYEAIAKGNEENLKKFLPHAITQDKDFLTNALCCAVMSKQTGIAKLLINDYEAKQDKQSPLYETTAKKIDDEPGREKILSPESKPEEKVETKDPFNRWKMSYPANFKTSETGEAFGKTINIFFEAFDLPLNAYWMLEFSKKTLVAAAGLALSIVSGIFEYVIPTVINKSAHLIGTIIGTTIEISKKKKGSEEIGAQKTENRGSATVKVEAEGKSAPEVIASGKASTGGGGVSPGTVVARAGAERLKRSSTRALG